ncbi:MAG TPA: NFACT RNA binding domain-containing protein [Candidatus Sulfotelmatobacter sp.]|nr:NFACT RNA binding domain-containing protein [Candidatus Sulfotelmatobacter sp.]
MYSAPMDAVFLSAALAEAREALEGARVAAVAADGPEGLALEARGPAGRACLCLGWEAWGPRWYLSPEPIRGGESHFAGAVAAALRGGRITALVRPGMERAVGIEVDWRRGRTARRLVLWGFLWPARRNAVLVDADEGLVAAAARPGAWRPGAPFVPPRADEGSWQVGGGEAFAARMRPFLDGGSGVEAALARAFPFLGPLMVKEVLARAGRAGASGAELGALWAAFAEVAEAARAERFAPRIVLGPDGTPQALAATVLSHVPGDRQRAYPTPGAAAHAFFAARRSAAEDREARARAGRALRQARERTARRMEKLEAELAAHRQAAVHRQMGEILVAQQRAVPRGAAEARLPDPYGPPGATRAIPLDPALSAAANAERYFKLARRGARGEALTARRLAASRRELDQIDEWEKALADATTAEALRELCAAMRRLPGIPSPESMVLGPGSPARRARSGGPRPRRADAESRVARRFVSEDGLAILVGRNNAANDELTLHIARPDDLWLHVEGYGGSHVVVRREGRAEVPRRTLAAAAQLAAYYSQARGQRKVPVHYTLRKHVRKPKGAKPGLVTITQEKTIFATADPEVVRRLAARAYQPAD